ncbi:MAG: ATP synthase F1 subunit gamma [Deltaproteobacteria bacterium]|nr:ATP synthase F1 subunit gamma [Deltaproteobacteria bacterium]
MATLRQIKRRLLGIKNIQQITRTMKMVAAVKLRRAQENILKARPYTFRLRDVISQLALRAEGTSHPLLQKREEKKVLLLVITSDRGLCGAFNSNINRKAERYVKSNVKGHESIELLLVGKKGRDYFRRRGYPIRKEYMGVLTDPTLERIGEIGSYITGEYIDSGLDAVYIIYNEFKSAVQQQVVVETILPIEPPQSVQETIKNPIDFLYEPDREKILNAVLPLYVNIQVYHAVLESLAAEMGARMTAMESATNNAKDLINRLTLIYNKTRQASITKELMDIIGGAEALK